MAIGEELTLEELRNILTDDKNPVGTDELLGLLSEFIGDDDISKVIDQHIEGLDEHWRWTIRVQEGLDLIDDALPHLHEIVKRLRNDD
jgi:hypothetical protein